MQAKTGILRDGKGLLQAIVSCLNQLLSECAGQEDCKSVFNLRAAPTISLSDYLARMFKYMNSSVSTFVYALILIDRVQEYNPQFLLHRRNMHRLLLAANVIAAKYLDDFFYKNSFYANVGGVALKVLNELEVEFLELLHYNAQIDHATFFAYLERLELFVEVNRQGEEKENWTAERIIPERKLEGKGRCSTSQGSIKGASLCANRDKTKPDDTVRTMVEQP